MGKPSKNIKNIVHDIFPSQKTHKKPVFYNSHITSCLQDKDHLTC